MPPRLRRRSIKIEAVGLRDFGKQGCPNEPGVAALVYLWRTRGPVNLGGGPPVFTPDFQARAAEPAYYFGGDGIAEEW